MARLYADENFPVGFASILRTVHDVLTSHEAGQSGQKIPDELVLSFAHEHGRAVLTHNRKHFRNLLDAGFAHSGIIICTADRDVSGLAGRILADAGELAGKLIRVVRPEV